LQHRVHAFDDPARLSGPGRGDPKQCPLVAGEAFLPLDVAVPLILIETVMVTLVLDENSKS